MTELVEPAPQDLAAEENILGACWIWPLYKMPSGYGRARGAKPGESPQYAHRWVYEQLIGPISDGFQIDHLCRNPSCVNPWHLEPVTPRENTIRGRGISSANARKTHCKHGHHFSEANTRFDKDGSRACRHCDRIRESEKRARRREAST